MTQVKSVMSRNARLARAIVGMDECSDGRTWRRRDLTSEEKRICRHMAHDGATVPEMAKAISWNLKISTLEKKLAAINIKSRGALAHWLHRHDASR